MVSFLVQLQYAKTHDVRLTSHLQCIGESKEEVVENCIKDLTIHGDEFDMMGLSRTPYNKINIHLGGRRKGQGRV